MTHTLTLRKVWPHLPDEVKDLLIAAYIRPTLCRHPWLQVVDELALMQADMDALAQ